MDEPSAPDTDGPLILLSNDDGVRARGIRTLRRALEGLGRVVTVAPAEEQSSKSHALTLSRPLRHRQLDDDVHSVDGTPADCIYVALYRELLLPRWPDLVVSGINHGFNLGTDVFYSGTVAAAREAALRGLPAMAVSLGPKGDFEAAAAEAARLAERMIAAEREGGALLSVNVPGGPPPYRGVRATRIGRRLYREEVTVREDPWGKEYYWLGGPGTRHEPVEGSDTEAVDDGYVSVTPLALDGTAPHELGLAAYVAGPPPEEGS
ncbi:MAG: 5'/3'-nucleotidase SurE [Sandaracinaceae bacterium]